VGAEVGVEAGAAAEEEAEGEAEPPDTEFLGRVAFGCPWFGREPVHSGRRARGRGRTRGTPPAPKGSVPVDWGCLRVDAGRSLGTTPRDRRRRRFDRSNPVTYGSIERADRFEPGAAKRGVPPGRAEGDRWPWWDGPGPTSGAASLRSGERF